MSNQEKLDVLKKGGTVKFDDGDALKSFYSFANIQYDTMPTGERVRCQFVADTFLVSLVKP